MHGKSGRAVKIMDLPPPFDPSAARGTSQIERLSSGMWRDSSAVLRGLSGPTPICQDEAFHASQKRARDLAANLLAARLTPLCFGVCAVSVTHRPQIGRASCRE